MIEAIAIIAIGALILLYAQRQSDKKLLNNKKIKSVDMRGEPMQKMKQKPNSYGIGITLIKS